MTTFTDKIEAFWTEMRLAADRALYKYGREVFAKVLEDYTPSYIALNENGAIEFQGTADDVANELDSVLAELSNN